MNFLCTFFNLFYDESGQCAAHIQSERLFTMNYCRKILACCLASALVSGCSISGEKNSARGFTISEMEQMSAVYHKEYSDNHNITNSAVKELRTSQCIMRALTRSVNGAYAGMRTEWAVDVTRDCNMNTVVLSHGHLLISNCVVGKLKNQDQEAYLIAHAFAHALLEHDNERITPSLAEKSKEKDYSFKQYLRSQGGYDVFSRAVGLPDRQGEVMPYSQEHEMAADIIAIQAMANAGFNPSAALIVWQNMMRDDELNSSLYVKTHPHSPEYLNQLSELIEQAMPVYRQARTDYGRVPVCQK